MALHDRLRGSVGPRFTLLGVLIAVLASTAGAAPEVARVVGVEGAALVRSPGGTSRVVVLDGVIRSGDTVVTAAGGGVGLLAGEHYVGLAGSTTAQLRQTEQGAPDVWVEQGRARVLASGDGPPARLGSETLVAANAGSDTDLFALREKPGLVSMLCPKEGPVNAGQGGQALTPGPGQCAIAKLGEPIYLADANHPPLPMLANPGGALLPGNPIARIGEPLPPVALGVAPSPLFQSAVDPLRSDPRNPCDTAGSCQASVPVAPGVVAPPINGPRPGGGPPL